jgi:hypothetical protein
MNSLSERIGQNGATINKLIILMAFMPYTVLKESFNRMETDGLLDAKHHSPILNGFARATLGWYT